MIDEYDETSNHFKYTGIKERSDNGTWLRWTYGLRFSWIYTQCTTWHEKYHISIDVGREGSH